MAPLVDHLWQSTLVALMAGLLALALHNNRAGVRYWVWLTASMKFLLPFSLLIYTGESLRPAAIAPIERPALTAAVEQITQPFSQATPLAASGGPASAHGRYLLPITLVTLWAAGSFVVAFRWWRKWGHTRGAVRVASPSGLAAGVPVLSTASLLEPGVFGILRPVLLLPEGITNRLTAPQLSAIVAHEMCHVRRRDNLTYALHMVVETMFWFHPLVWWMGARLVQERERACDEAVLQAGNSGEVYAEGILNVCRFYVESPLACVSGVSGADLKERIVRIMTARLGTRLSLAHRTALIIAAIVAAGGPIGLGLLRAQAPVQLLHADGASRPSFDAATIKPSQYEKQDEVIGMAPENFSMRHTSLKGLIRFAYDIRTDDRILRAPNWMNSEFFDIQAKASESEIDSLKGLTFEKRIEASKLMVQSLLADRFQLRANIQKRDLPIYALVVANGGPKLKEVEPSPFPAPGTAPPPGAHVPSFEKTRPNQFTATAMPVRAIADFLTSFDEIGNRLVMDETGLKGNYDFVLSGISMEPSQDPGVISIFTAIQEQLGLKLISRKRAVEVLVIDRVEKPSAN